MIRSRTNVAVVGKEGPLSFIEKVWESWRAAKFALSGSDSEKSRNSQPDA